MVRTIAAAANAQKLLIWNPGVKKAVIARTIPAVTNLPTICQTVLLVFDLVCMFVWLSDIIKTSFIQELPMMKFHGFLELL